MRQLLLAAVLTLPANIVPTQWVMVQGSHVCLDAAQQVCGTSAKLFPPFGNSITVYGDLPSSLSYWTVGSTQQMQTQGVNISPLPNSGVTGTVEMRGVVTLRQ